MAQSFGVKGAFWSSVAGEVRGPKYVKKFLALNYNGHKSPLI